jgi:hypothetical protein
VDRIGVAGDRASEGHAAGVYGAGCDVMIEDTSQRMKVRVVGGDYSVNRFGFG